MVITISTLSELHVCTCQCVSSVYVCTRQTNDYLDVYGAADSPYGARQNIAMAQHVSKTCLANS